MRTPKMYLLAAVTCLLAAVFGAGLTTTSASAAAGCYGDYCSGKDPSTTGVGGVPCANDAVTVARTEVYVDYIQAGVDPATRTDDVGFVELRWSKHCQTNWARFTANISSYVNRVVATQDTGYQQNYQTSGYWNGTNPGVFWTDMIYSPVHHVAASVDCEGSSLTGCGHLNQTAWI